MSSELKLKDVVAISGRPGLYKIIGQRPAGLVVESLDEEKKRFPTTITQKVSVLSDISIYTYDGDTPLGQVFKNVYEKSKDGLYLVSKRNSSEEINEFMRTILPDYDEDQVYKSDIVKIALWYDILQEHIDFSKYEADAEDAADSDEEE
jgi:hypothetical protein